MRAKKVKRPSKERRGLSRPALDRELVILTERLLDQVWLAKAIITANAPNEQHVVIEHRLRTVFGLQIEALERGRTVRTHTRMRCVEPRGCSHDRSKSHQGRQIGKSKPREANSAAFHF
jgi:hypothetical protein